MLKAQDLITQDVPRQLFTLNYKDRPDTSRKILGKINMQIKVFNLKTTHNLTSPRKR